MMDVSLMFRDVLVAESDEDKPGVILDYDAAGNIVSIEVLDASRRVEEPPRRHRSRRTVPTMQADGAHTTQH
jgi:YD repeat-containing protein